MKAPLLIGTTYSPWTERARWALDAASSSYRFVPHVALIGELRLRLLARRFRGRISAPLYVSEASGVLGDSFEIAQHAGRSPGGEALFPAGQLAAITDWNARSEPALSAGRLLAMQRSLRDPEALAASVPRMLFNTQASDRFFGALGIRYVVRKYAAVTGTPEQCEAVQRKALSELCTALSGRDYLLGSFSYADITAAMPLAFVSPRPELMPGKLASWARAWTSPELARAFPELLEWRDMLYARHRARAC